MVRIYKKANFMIYTDYNGGYIIHNAKKEFSQGHTHIREFSTAKYLVNLALHKSLPNRNLKYFVESLIRISTDPIYVNKLMELSKQKLQRKKKKQD